MPGHQRLGEGLRKLDHCEAAWSDGGAGRKKLSATISLGSSLPLPRHALTENFVDPAQVAATLRFEPIQNLIVDSERDLGLEGAVVLADSPRCPGLRVIPMTR